MTWSQLHDRMAFIADMIELASTDPDAALALDGKTDEVQRLFGDEDGLLLALRHRWTTMLTAKLDQAVYEGVSAEAARASLVAANPGLCALLDGAVLRSVRVRALARSEQRIVAMYSGPGGDCQTVA